MFLWTSALMAQIAKDVYDGTYQNQIIPPGQNIPLNYNGPAAVLYDNGPLVTHAGGGSGGADASALQTALGMGVYGFGHAISAGYTVADDFTISGDDWTIEELHFFAYQTGSSTTSTINDYRVQIYNGDPSTGGTVIWGDLSTNVFTSSTWSNIYRVLDTDLLASNRPIMETTVHLGTPIVLSAGTYWIRWQAGGTLSSGPWIPPVTVLGSTGTGNAYQETGGTWTAVTDVGPQDFPFLVIGTSGGGGGGLYYESFESYISGQQVACQNPVDWTTWSMAPCGNDDALVSSNYAQSGTNSALIDFSSPRWVDLVKPLGNVTSGHKEIRFSIYIPQGKGGYFNTLGDFAGAASIWAMQVYFNVDGTASIDAGTASAATWNYTQGVWHLCQVIINLGADQAQFWFDGTMIHQWQYTLGTFGGGCPLQIGANDFFAPAGNATDEMYLDDYYFGDYPVPVELTSFTADVNNSGYVVLNWETATELNNLMFEIERKDANSEFRTIGYVDGAGTTTEPQQYSYTDATVSNGSYTYRLKQVDYDGRYYFSDAIEIEVKGPLTFTLEQNYPNPFNPSTNIKFSVPESGDIKLAIYNVVGEEVAVLVDGFTEAGFYNVTFNASSLPSGVYLYKLQSANSVETRKMMLLK
jgi:hypothetical protein